MKPFDKFQKRWALLITFFIVSITTFSQVSNYSFTQSAGSYTPIAGTALFTTAWDDNQTPSATPLNIGFNFTFNGNVYTQARVSSNGFLTFSTNPGSTNYFPISSATAYAGCVAVFARDLINTGSTLQYLTLGSAPNRVFVVQWNNAARYSGGTIAGDAFNFQIRLSETTNEIQVVYGSCVATSATALTCQVGLRGANNTDFNNRTTTTDWSATTAGAVNNASCTSTNSVLPSSGLTFIWTPPVVCTGTPVAGTTASTLNPICSGVNFTLSLTGTTAASGLTYQWQSSPDGITYTNIAVGTTATFTTNQAAATYYQAIVTCTTSGLSDTSAPFNETMNSPSNCYCTSSATSAVDEDIFNVTLGTLNNSSTCATTGGPGSTLNMYSNYTSTVAAPVLTQGTTYPFSVEIGTCGSNFGNATRIYIDYNQNGLFTDVGEDVYISAASTTGPHIESGTLTIPIGAIVGNTRMRVITRETATPTSITPCITYNWGETEDYTINIIAAMLCAGTPSVGSTLSTSASVCTGANFTLSLSTPPSGFLGITYQWQSSTDNVTYTNIGGATNSTYSTTQTVPTYYQAVVTCTNSGSSDTSTSIQVLMNSFLNCYCTSNATSGVDEDILNVTLRTLNNSSTCGTTGGPGSTLNMYSDYTTIAAAPNLIQLSTNPFSVQVGTCGGNFGNATRIYIDFNHNASFADAGENVYTSAASTTGAHIESGNITIPIGAIPGNTRMRVITKETGAPTSITPCGTYGWGETEDYFVNIIPLPPNPPTPVQDPSIPTCAMGTNLTVPGSPAAGDAWFWQVTANGTSTANPVSGPYTVYLDRTYYVRTYNATNNIWSLGSDSVVVTNIPLAPTPPSPVAAANPACVSTTISMITPPSGTGYFWQGSLSLGASNAQSTSTPFPITASGTYYVAAYDSATSCWSNTNNISVLIDTYVPAVPTVSSAIAICQGSASALIHAIAPASSSLTASFGSALISVGDTTLYSMTFPALPAGATITNTRLQIYGATAIGDSYQSEIRIGLTGATTLASTQISTVGAGGLVTPNPVITIPNLPVVGGAVTLKLMETSNDIGNDATFDSVKIVVNYTIPVSTISWFDASSGGVLQGSGSPFQTIGTIELPNSITPGTFVFYAASKSGSCFSSRMPVNVVVNALPTMALTNDTICSGNPYFLDAQNSGATYLWNTAEITQTIAPASSGLYYVDITTSAGCTARDSMDLLINNPPIVNLGADVSFCAGDSILLDGANTGFSFLWNNGTTAQTLTTDTSGNYFVKVTNPLTMCFASDTIAVTVNQIPVINLGANTGICVGDSLVLDAGMDGDSYSWNNSSTNQTLTVQSPGTYFVFVSNSLTSCYNSDTITITQNALPLVFIGADTTICMGNNLLLNAGHPGFSYLWNNSSTSQTLNVNAAGTYSVQVTDPNGCKGSDTIIVATKATPIVNLGSDTTKCGGSVVLNAGNSGSVFLWNDGSSSQTLSATSTGSFYVSVTGGNGCKTSDSINVTINPLPIVNLGNDTAVCGSLILNGGNPGFNHLWSDNSTGQTFTVSSTGNLSITVTDPSTGCVSSDAIHVTVNQKPIVKLGSDSTQCGGSITLKAGSGGSALWNTGATTSIINVTTSGMYYVNVTSGTCITSDTIQITIHTLPLVGFPAIQPVCIQSQPFNLNATPAGGTFSGGSFISGTMFDASMAGVAIHTVTYTYTDANSCSNSIDQDIKVVDCVGIEEYVNSTDVTIYPNPSTGKFNIRIANAKYDELNIRITDLQGKEVYNFTERNINSDYNKQVDLEGMAKGIYFIKMNTGSELKINKLIIN